MKKVIFILVCLYPVFVFSAINETITDVYFANGILTEKEDAYKNLDLIEENILFNEYAEDEDKMKEELHFDLAYNGTYGESLDILESLTQKLGKFELIDDTLDLLADILDVSVKESDLTIQVKAYKDSIRAGHRVLTVAHSQGNLFTYDAYRDLDTWMQDYFYAISVASPGHLSIRDGTRSISWDNDVVAKLGLYGGLEPNPVRKVSWELLTEDGHQITTPRPDFNYIIKEQIGVALKNDWKGAEGITSNFDSNVHAFSFYMGGALKIDSKIPVINPFDEQVLQTNKAKSRIMGAIKYGLKALKKVPSQWNITDKSNEGTKEYLGTFTHKYASEASQLTGLIFKDDNNSAFVYQVPDTVGVSHFVKASIGGGRILSADDVNEWEAGEGQFYKLEGAGEIIEGEMSCKDPSIFEVISQENENTADWRVTVKNTETNETREGVYPFNLQGSLYQLENSDDWVLASCGGTDILSVWDGQEENELLKLENTEEIIRIGRFVRDDSSEIVTDTETGRMWQDDIEAKTIRKTWLTRYNWRLRDYFDTSGDTAASYCENLIFAGYNDWRLPEIKELCSINATSIDHKSFLNFSSHPYLSSTTMGSKDSSVRQRHFFHGGKCNAGYIGSSKMQTRNVRCVRAGQQSDI